MSNHMHGTITIGIRIKVPAELIDQNVPKTKNWSGSFWTC
jgi:hypothetical protein